MSAFYDEEKVRVKFMEFVHALAWESTDIDEGASEEEVYKHIDLYVKMEGDKKILDFRNEYMNFLLEVDKKFKIEVFAINNDGNEPILEHCDYTDEFGEAMDIVISQLGRGQRIFVKVYLREQGKFSKTCIYQKSNY